MTDLSDKLSAYLDGELPDLEAQEVEAWLERDPEAQAQLEALMHVDTLAQEVFDAQLQDPVPLALARSIQTTDLPADEPVRSAPQTVRRPIWGALAAGLVLLMVGGAGGYAMRGANAPVQTAGWLQDIAEYHAVYAGQNRHLVEVGADQSDHLQAWLGSTLGVQFTIPDLSEQGLSFQGGRLLVANGAPVAQLMYRDADGQVIALCLQQNNAAPTSEFQRQTIAGFDFVSWRAETAKYVVIGPQGDAQLDEIAQVAARVI